MKTNSFILMLLLGTITERADAMRLHKQEILHLKQPTGQKNSTSFAAPAQNATALAKDAPAK